jgi:hypothetical protein
MMKSPQDKANRRGRQEIDLSQLSGEYTQKELKVRNLQTRKSAET